MILRDFDRFTTQRDISYNTHRQTLLVRSVRSARRYRGVERPIECRLSRQVAQALGNAIGLRPSDDGLQTNAHDCALSLKESKFPIYRSAICHKERSAAAQVVPRNRGITLLVYLLFTHTRGD